MNTWLFFKEDELKRVGSVSFPLLVHVWWAPNLLHECGRHLITVFQHTLWLAPLTAFGNVCLLSLASLHLEHAPEKLPGLCAVGLVVISCTSAVLRPKRIFQLSALCHREARAVTSPLDSLTITPVRFPKSHLLTRRQRFPSVIHSVMSACACV